MMLPQIQLTIEERDLILESLGDKIPQQLFDKLTPYIKKPGHILTDCYVLLWKKPSDNILDWKVSTVKVDYVDDYSPTRYECWIKRNHATPLKTDIFTERSAATLAGHERHLKLLYDVINSEKDDIDWSVQYKIVAEQERYDKLIKSIKRKIYLINLNPEKYN